MRYTKEYKKEISFPLGGIGSGSIGLSGNGSFVDIEIFNRPNKATTAEFTHFAIKAEDDKRVIDARVLHTDKLSGYVGSLERARYTGYGFGPDRGTMAGFPHFDKGEFNGRFPIAELDFAHDKFPGNVTMTAFNPFIPTNEDDSSIPAAFFEFEIENTHDKKLTYTLALSCNNYYAKQNAVNTYGTKQDMQYIFLSNMNDKQTTDYGDLTIATDCENVSFQEYWFRGSWFDNVSVFWNDFTTFGALKNRNYEKETDIHQVFKDRDIATLAARVEMGAHTKKKIRFVLSWHMPYMRNFWQITHIGLSEAETKKRRAVAWKNYYAVLFENSLASATYAMRNFTKLYEYTKIYTDIIYRSALPEAVLDAVTANISILKSTTCLRLEDGSFYGFEGVHAHLGSCEGTCTHVWSYAYAAAYLFPKLERSARKLEYTESMQQDGGMGFRVQLPLGVGATNHRPAVDGQFGTVMRVYREFMISGDKEWLAGIWEAVKQTIAYAWSEKNPDKWDYDKDGIMEGRQHHTLDMELFGPNSWLSGMYLGGLLAGAKLALVMEDADAYQEYMQVYESGVKILNEQLFHGTYFYQKINLEEKALLEKYKEGKSDHSGNAVEDYWNEESGQMKYQIGEGCSIDQVLGQWHADLLGLGNIFEDEKVKSSLKAIFQYNYVQIMREHINPCRIYSLDDESGTVICAYPKEAKKPHIPVPYAEETMHGFEYQAAGHMIQRGLEKEGLACVKAVRDKYDGNKRNPWNEMECGSTYARSMASYALLLVYSGFKVDMNRKMIGFAPIHKENARFFWSIESGFGEVVFSDSKIVLSVAYGSLEIKYLDIEFQNIKSITCGEAAVAYEVQDYEVVLEKSVVLEKNQALVIA